MQPSFVTFTALVALFFAVSGGTNGAAVAQPLVSQIELFRSAVGLSNNGREVGGIVPCGAVGEIVDVTFTGCDHVPCQVHVGNAYEVAVEFKPAVSHPSLRLEIILIHNGANHPVVDVPVPDSDVEAGRQYRLAYTLRFTDAYLGPATLAFRLHGAASTEICFIVGLDISHP